MFMFKKTQVFTCFLTFFLLLLPSCLLAEVLVVTGINNPLVSMSKSQVGALFTGKVSSFPNGGRATPIDMPESNPLRTEFYSKVTNMSVAQAREIWAKLYFTGRGVPPRVAADAEDIKKMVNLMPGAIGYIGRSSLDNSVKVIMDVK